MINLLPPKLQKEIRAARSNTLLLRYVILLVAALGFLLIALVATYLSLSTTATQADATKKENEQKATGFTETQAAASKLRGDLATAKTLFEGETRYSLALVRLSNLLPEGAALDSLQLSPSSFTESMALTVRIRNQQTAEALQNNFMSSPYVSNVSLGRITTTGSPNFPYSAEISFTLNRSIGQ